LKLNDKVQVKVLEVDVVRKRIALSIKQTQEAPTVKRSGGSKPVHHQRTQTPQQDMGNMNMNDALSLLKKKFGK
jgi:protein Tex